MRGGGFAESGREGGEGGGVVWGMMNCYGVRDFLLTSLFSRAESCCWGGMTLIARHIKIARYVPLASHSSGTIALLAPSHAAFTFRLPRLLGLYPPDPSSPPFGDAKSAGGRVVRGNLTSKRGSGRRGGCRKRKL